MSETFKETKSLKQLRKTTNKDLLPPCGNCGHRRYAKCGCKRSHKAPGEK
jgi:uncharacterized cysteine cluster protein YcgN (CxxCxxCC family)